MLERPKLAGAAKTGLHFIEDEERPVSPAPGGELADIIDRGEVRPDSLVRFKEHTGHLVAVNPLLFQGRFKYRKTRVRGPVPIWKRHLNKRRILVYNPGLLARNPAGLLCAQGASMKTSLRADNSDFFATSGLYSMSSGELDGAFSGFRTGAQEKHLFQVCRRHAGQRLD